MQLQDFLQTELSQSPDTAGDTIGSDSHTKRLNLPTHTRKRATVDNQAIAQDYLQRSATCKGLLLKIPRATSTQRHRTRSHPRPGSQVMHVSYCPRHIENRRSRIALLAVCPIPAAMNMILADVVFAAEGVLKVPGALVERSSLWTAAFPVMHAASHIDLTFPYCEKAYHESKDGAER